MRFLAVTLIGFAVSSGWQAPVLGQVQSPPVPRDSLLSRAELEGEEAGLKREQLGYFATSFLSAFTVGFLAPNIFVENPGTYAMLSIPGVAGLVTTASVASRRGVTVPPEIESQFVTRSPEYQVAFVRGYKRGVFRQRKRMVWSGGLVGALLGFATLVIVIGAGGGS